MTSDDWRRRRRRLAPYARRPGLPRTYEITFPDTGEVELVALDGLVTDQERFWLTLPNALTALRIALVPVIAALVLVGTATAAWWAFGIFTFAAITDKVDGSIARRWENETRFGQIADPIADKLLIVGTLAILAYLQRLPWWAVVVIAVRDAGVTLLRVRLVHARDLVMPASRWGKWKTASQVVAVSTYLLPAVPRAVSDGLLYVAVAATVLSGFEYTFRAGRLVRDADAAP